MTPRRRGFTLIELTVVIFLIGLLLLTAMPKLGNFLYQGDLRRVARSLKAAVPKIIPTQLPKLIRTAALLSLDIEKRKASSLHPI